MVIHGARQVGKTWALKYFGQEYFEDVAYFSLDKDESGLCDIFKTTKDPERIIQQLSFLHGRKINPQTTLLILDEIQECNEALNSLKYFCEEAPEYAVACAGSLLRNLPESHRQFLSGWKSKSSVYVSADFYGVSEYKRPGDVSIYVSLSKK